MTTNAPVSVIIATYNRADKLPIAVDSVLGQTNHDLELVIVDDGSTDATADYLATLTDERVRVIRQKNQGMTSARNRGIAEALGGWIAFLDDDDALEPKWLSELVALTGDTVGVVSCGLQAVSPEGELLEVSVPGQSSPLYSTAPRGSFIAGTCIVRAECLRAIGGLLLGLPASHHAELGYRIIDWCRVNGKSIELCDKPLVRLEKRDARDRPLATPQQHFDSFRWLMVRYPALLSRSERARFEGVIGIGGMRVGRYREGRRFLLRSALHRPLDVRSWARLAASVVRTKTWGGLDGWSQHSGAASSRLSMVRDLRSDASRASDSLFLPWGYLENPQRSSDAEGTPFWEGGLTANDVRYQVPVYNLVRRVVSKSESERPVVMDIGSGSGHKLATIISKVATTVGVDQESGVSVARDKFPDQEWLVADFADETTWSSLGERHPDYVLCADVVEHVDDPYNLLGGIRQIIGTTGQAIISTPDRSRLDATPLGPPGNPRHIREWTSQEFQLLLEASGLDVVWLKHVLPRSYSATRPEFNRAVYRVLHGKASPDRRSCMVFCVRASGEAL